MIGLKSIIPPTTTLNLRIQNSEMAGPPILLSFARPHDSVDGSPTVTKHRLVRPFTSLGLWAVGTLHSTATLSIQSAPAAFEQYIREFMPLFQPLIPREQKQLRRCCRPESCVVPKFI
ncbi:hypothetical protein B0H14DRAFT_3156276 [Mycena olivaceomarginata]|nr:hypothetical protein B0H14DRAFT_3156276 [Mycena olivaceomarginata]